MKKVFFFVAAWLVIANVFAFVTVNRFHLSADTAYTWINPKEFPPASPSDSFVADHAHWDGKWYLDIAQNGYHLQKDSALSNVVFFPAYPFLIWIFGNILLQNFALAGWLVSIVALFFAARELFLLTKEFHDKKDPYLPLLLLLIFPTAFFLNAVYTEALFLFFSIATIRHARRNEFLLGGIFGALAALTRVTGVLLFIPLVWEFVIAYKQKRTSLKSLAPIFLPPLATFGFFLFHLIRFGNFFLFFAIEKSWGRGFSIEASHFIFHNPTAITNIVFDVLYIIVGIIGTVCVYKKIRPSYAAYMAISLAVPLATGTTMSIGRYLLVLFPLYLLLAKTKNTTFFYVWVFSSTLLFAITTMLFINNYWAG